MILNLLKTNFLFILNRTKTNTNSLKSSFLAKLPIFLSK